MYKATKTWTDKSQSQEQLKCFAFLWGLTVFWGLRISHRFMHSFNGAVCQNQPLCMTWHSTLTVPVTFGRKNNTASCQVNRLWLYIGSRHEGADIFILHIWRVGDQGSWGETWDSKVTASRWAHLNLCVTALWLTDRPANHNVEQYSEEDDGHSGGDSDQHYLTVLTGDGKGCG